MRARRCVWQQEWPRLRRLQRTARSGHVERQLVRRLILAHAQVLRLALEDSYGKRHILAVEYGSRKHQSHTLIHSHHNHYDSSTNPWRLRFHPHRDLTRSQSSRNRIASAVAGPACPMGLPPTASDLDGLTVEEALSRVQVDMMWQTPTCSLNAKLRTPIRNHGTVLWQCVGHITNPCGSALVM